MLESIRAFRMARQRSLSLSSAVNKYGTLKYKKRFLERKVRGL